MNIVTALLLIGNRRFGLWMKCKGSEGWLLFPQSSALTDGATGITSSENRRRLIPKLVDGPCRRRLLLGTTVMRERLLHPYDHMGLEAPSRNVCPEKWKRSCEYFPVFTVGRQWGDVNFLCRPPFPPPPPPLVPPAARDQTVSPIPSRGRKRPRPVYLELVPLTTTFFSLPTSSL